MTEKQEDPWGVGGREPLLSDHNAAIGSVALTAHAKTDAVDSRRANKLSKAFAAWLHTLHFPTAL